MPDIAASQPKMNRSTISLVACSAMHTVVSLFANTFLVAYLLNISASNDVLGSASRVGIYYMVVYAIMAVFYPLFSVFVKRTKRVGLYRLGVFLVCGFVFLVAFFQAHIAEYYYLFAIYFGLANGLYWACFNTMQSEVVSSRMTKKYFAINTSVSTVVNITVPILLGTSIDLSSFMTTAIYVFVVSVIQFGITFFIKNERAIPAKFELKKFLQTLREPKYKLIKDVYVISYLHGVKHMLPTVITVLTVMTFKTNFSLGMLTSIFSAVSIVTLLMYTRFGNKKNTWIILLCGILPALSVIGLLVEINPTTLILYNFVFSVCLVIIDLINSSNRSGIIRELSLYPYVMEHQAISEFTLNSGRVTAYITLFTVAMINNVIVLKVFLGLSILVVPALSVLIFRIQNKINKIDHSHYALEATLAPAASITTIEVQKDIITCTLPVKMIEDDIINPS